MMGKEMNAFLTDFTLTDIGKAANIVTHGTRIIPHHRHHQPFREIVALFMPIPDFTLPETRLLEGSTDLRIDTFIRSFSLYKTAVFTNNVLSGITRDLRKCAIHIHNDIVGIHNRDAFTTLLKYLRQEIYPRNGTLLLGNIFDDKQN